MQYVAFIYQGSTPLPGTPAWDALTEAERQAVYADYASLNQRAGVTPGLPLAQPGDATTVRVQDGKALITDGPFADTKEAIGGWFVIEAADLDAALEIAATVPAARLGGAIEIRPVEKYW